MSVVAAASLVEWVHAVFIYATVYRLMRPHIERLMAHERAIAVEQETLGRFRLVTERCRCAFAAPAPVADNARGARGGASIRPDAGKAQRTRDALRGERFASFAVGKSKDARPATEHQSARRLAAR